MRQVTDQDQKFEVLPVVEGVFTRPSGVVYDFYLNETIESPSQYVAWNHIIRSAAERDIIYLHINCYGGDVMTAIQLMRSIAESNAHVIASVEGACMSAATFLFLIADSFEISEHSIFMFHNYSGFSFGKGNEMRDKVNHEEKWSKHLLDSIYLDFLSPEEITEISNGKDFWMTPKEVQKRLELRVKKWGKKTATTKSSPKNTNKNA
jgi:ATP-dependent protease ClpP protease subunit